VLCHREPSPKQGGKTEEEDMPNGGNGSLLDNNFKSR